MRGRKLRALRTDGASKSRMIEPSFFLNYPSKNQKILLQAPQPPSPPGRPIIPPKKATLLGNVIKLR